MKAGAWLDGDFHMLGTTNRIICLGNIVSRSHDSIKKLDNILRVTR